MSLIKIDSNKIINAMEKRGIKQSILAELAGVSQGLVSTIITNGAASEKTLIKVSKALKKPFEHFIYRGEEISHAKRRLRGEMSIDIDTSKIEKHLYITNLNNQDFCLIAQIDSSNFTRILRRGACTPHIAEKIANAMSIPLDELILTKASSPVDSKEIDNLAIEAKQISLTDETAQEFHDEYMEPWEEPSRNLYLKYAAITIKDAKKIADFYGIDFSDALKVVEICNTEFEGENDEN